MSIRAGAAPHARQQRTARPFCGQALREGYVEQDVMKQEPEATEIAAGEVSVGNESGHLGRVTVAPEVLLTIVRQTVLSQAGIARFSNRHMPKLGSGKMRTASAEGLRIEIAQDNSVGVGVRLVVSSQVNMRELAQMLQTEITRALQTMVDMKTREVNVHIDAVEMGAGSSQETTADHRSHRR